MNKPVTKLKILTLGRYSMTVDGKPVATVWPNEMLKVFFCSLISPLDLYFTWDRICRSMLSVPETRTSRRQLEETLIRPLNSFLIQELGFTPLIAGLESIKINQQRIYVDALEFHSAVIEGLRLLSLGNQTAALTQLNTANALYTGSYLPGMSGKIILNTRNELEALYRIAIMEALRHAKSSLSGPTEAHRIAA